MDGQTDTAAREAWKELLRDDNPEKSERVMAAILQMSKPDMQQVQNAYDGR